MVKQEQENTDTKIHPQISTILYTHLPILLV